MQRCDLSWRLETSTDELDVKVRTVVDDTASQRLATEHGKGASTDARRRWSIY